MRGRNTGATAYTKRTQTRRRLADMLKKSFPRTTKPVGPTPPRRNTSPKRG